MSGDDSACLFEATFEIHGGDREAEIHVDRESPAIGGDVLLLWISGRVAMTTKDTVENARVLVRDIDTIKYHLSQAQRAINDHIGDMINGGAT